MPGTCYLSARQVLKKSEQITDKDIVNIKKSDTSQNSCYLYVDSYLSDEDDTLHNILVELQRRGGFRSSRRGFGKGEALFWHGKVPQAAQFFTEKVDGRFQPAKIQYLAHFAPSFCELFLLLNAVSQASKE
jgi:hypothetical protein